MSRTPLPADRRRSPAGRWRSAAFVAASAALLLGLAAASPAAHAQGGRLALGWQAGLSSRVGLYDIPPQYLTTAVNYQHGLHGKITYPRVGRYAIDASLEGGILVGSRRFFLPNPRTVDGTAYDEGRTTVDATEILLSASALATAFSLPLGDEIESSVDFELGAGTLLALGSASLNVYYGGTSSSSAREDPYFATENTGFWPLDPFLQANVHWRSNYLFDRFKIRAGLNFIGHPAALNRMTLAVDHFDGLFEETTRVNRSAIRAVVLLRFERSRRQRLDEEPRT